jgi:NAD(P)-dependent dehydrogenase (short-subunit alcohol dehydrogenase family)
VQYNNILITGGTDGQGKATAHRHAKLGARLLLVGRNRERGEAAVAEVINACGNKAVTFLPGDLPLVREMRRVADQTRKTFDRLDVLVFGAGGGFPQQRKGKFDAISKASAANELLTLEQISCYPDITFYNYGPGLVRAKLLEEPLSLCVRFSIQ